MKFNKSIPLLLGSLLLLSACGIPSNNETSHNEGTSQQEGSSPTSSQGGNISTSEGGQTENDLRTGELSSQEGVILHAWNWSLTNVQNELENIKNAGYTTIQLSPLQPQKDYYNGQNWSSQWWKLYQPLGLCVANGNNQNVLGTKTQLQSLCTAAKNKGLKIIVDVVTNHLAGGSKTSLNDGVGTYESTIKNNNLIHTYGQYANDNNLQSIVQGNIGDFPDLKTEDERVQERVISMLKEYMDCGVTGFRFDAAKHIETPDDGTYASQYWPNVTRAINSYATSKNYATPYIYGEVLNTPGSGRNWNSYTTYMSVVDNKQGWDILTAVRDGNTGSLKTNYNSGVNADHLVLWSESHDMYANDSGYDLTKNIDSSYINKAYMVQASRKDATSLYFVRPGNAQMGAIGTTDYKSKSITAINKFHNLFAGRDESISNDGNVFVNVRGNKTKGAALICLGNDTSKEVNVNLPNGEYKNLIDNSKVVVNNKKVTAKFTDGACIIVPGTGEAQKNTPTITMSANKEVFSDTAAVSISVTNATTSSYQINNGNAVTFTGSTSVNVGNGLSNGTITVKVTATNSDGTVNKTIELVKTNLTAKKILVKNVPNNVTLLLWSWADGGQGNWYEFTKDGTTYGSDLPQANFLIARFASGTTASNADWKKVTGQTADMTFTKQLLDYNEFFQD